MKKQLKILIINSEYSVIVCWGDFKYAKSVAKAWGHEKILEEEDLKERRGVCLLDAYAHPIIVLPRFPKTPEEIGTLAHEACHAIENIFRKLQEDTRDEVFAHSVGAVVRTVLSHKK